MSSTFPRLSSTIASSIRSKSFSTTKVLQRSLATHASINPTTSTYSTSSSSSTSTWSPPIEPSSEPAYESALEFLKAYSHKTLSQVEELQRQLKKDQSNLSDQQKLELKNRIHKLSIAAEINDPKRRWEFAQGKADLSLPVHRHLREQAWRKGGSLDKLTERITLQRVIPDLIPSITPTVDLQIFLGQGNGISDHSTPACFGEILTGVKIQPFKLFENVPQISATVFHKEIRNYTLMMIDMDVPNPEEEGFETFCHWLINDIPLSATNSSPSLTSSAMPYIPVHPAEGSGVHRYAFLLLSQPETKPLSSPSSSEIKREGFNVRSYVHKNGLEAQGIHFFRSEWKRDDEKSRGCVSKVWREIRGIEEPKYGRPPKVDRLKDVFGEKESRYY